MCFTSVRILVSERERNNGNNRGEGEREAMGCIIISEVPLAKTLCLNILVLFLFRLIKSKNRFFNCLFYNNVPYYFLIDALLLRN